MKVTFERAHNGRVLVKVGDEGAWVGTIAPSGSDGWWYVPRGGKGWWTYRRIESCMKMVERTLGDDKEAA